MYRLHECVYDVFHSFRPSLMNIQKNNIMLFL